MTTEVGLLLEAPITTTAGDESVGAVVELGQILITGVTPIAGLEQVSTNVPTLTAAVYDDTNGTKLADLDSSHARRFQDELSGAGSGQLSVDVDDSAAQHLDIGNHVRFSINDVAAFTFRIAQRDYKLVDTAEEYGQTLSVSGPGVVDLLANQIVYPYGGVAARPVADSRPFSWASPEYDASGWPACVVQYDRIAFQLGVDPPLMEPWFPPKGWPTPMTVDWIWSRARYSGGNQHPAGRCYFRKTVTLGSDKTLAFFLSADDRARVFIDGKEVQGWTNQFPEDSFLDCWVAKVPVSAGSHVFAIEGETYAGNPDRPRRGMVALSVHQQPTGANTYSSSTLLVGTDSTWTCLDYPTVVPAPTPGKIILTLLTERNARTGGSVGQWTTTFTDGVDSAGAAWSQPYEFTARIGDDILSVLKAMADTAIDFHADPVGRVLHMWNKDSADSNAATYAAGTDLLSLAHSGRA